MSGAPRPVLFLALPMAISVRDVLRTGVLARVLETGAEVHLFAPRANLPALEAEFGGPRVRFHALVRPDSRAFDLLDTVLLRLHTLVLSLRCETVAIMTTASRRLPWVRMARALLRPSRSAQGALIELTRRAYAAFQPDLYGEIFASQRPDVVVGTRALTMVAPGKHSGERYLDRHLLVDAARRGVSTMVLVASWDNLTTSGFFPVRVDRLVVWNEVMREQAVEVHGLVAARVDVTGAPQHDVYAAGAFVARDTFVRSLDLDPERPVVVYATGTDGLVPDEPELVEALADRLRDALPEAQLLVRVHQLGRREAYAALEGRDGVAVDQAGLPRDGAYPDRAFDRTQLERLADTLRHADVVVNYASSISIDAAAVGTPVVVPDFDARPGRPYHRSGRRFYDFTHQRALLACGGVARASDMDALVAAVRAYIEDPASDAEGRARLVERHAHRVDGRSAERMADAVVAQVERARGSGGGHADGRSAVAAGRGAVGGSGDGAGGGAIRGSAAVAGGTAGARDATHASRVL